MRAARWLAAFSLLCTTPAFANPCRVVERHLLGAWKRDGSGSFEEIEFSRAGATRTFDSWLHHRPDMLGARWWIRGCALSIFDTRDTNISYDYYIVRLTRTTLTLRDIEDKSLTRYRRLP
jgi:hypothetical protein